MPGFDSFFLGEIVLGGVIFLYTLFTQKDGSRKIPVFFGILFAGIAVLTVSLAFYFNWESDILHLPKEKALLPAPEAADPEAVVSAPTEEPAPPPAIVASGTCGSDMTWELNEAGLLTISGTGNMEDYGKGHLPPWLTSGFREQVFQVRLENGVSGIGQLAFIGCTSLTSATIPDSVLEIGAAAFQGCFLLTGVEIPDGVTEIRDYVFDNCASLTSVSIPDSVTKIGTWAFHECNNLTSVSVPAGAEIAESAFPEITTVIRK